MTKLLRILGILALILLVSSPVLSATSEDVTITANPLIITPPSVTNGIGATEITNNDAKLNGEITSTGNENPSTWIFWGTTDGGTDPNSWSNNISLGTKPLGTFYSNLTDVLLPLTQYFYRCAATNSAGTGWASNTANFTTITLLLAPTNFVLTDTGAISINATWTQGIGSTYTMIRIKRSTPPSNITDGELFYYGSSEMSIMSSFNLETTDYIARAWGFASDNITYSNNFAEARIGGTGMTLLALLLSAVILCGIAWGLKIPVLAYAAVALFMVTGFYLFGQSTSDWDLYFLAGFETEGIAISIGLAAMSLMSKEEEEAIKDLDNKKPEERRRYKPPKFFKRPDRF